ncbi:PREDICTED: peptidoglycan-recognition protein LE-like [Nicrophorus vespilloides]|uniref:Peptidoglycan-recognition protein LE-like n=1 Tax=Nicrophorus vespilloides TaxID=110193 RepID=A0ABM1MHL3_NICVS|nr:PREDICTED: peptidoglycan-recognition protein LE-like [Nicrophorus vespilloides]
MNDENTECSASVSANTELESVQQDKKGTAIEKCSKWLEECSLDDTESISTCDTSDLTSECSTFDDSLSYDSKGIASINAIKTNGDYNIDSHQLGTLVSASNNIYQNVTINKSKKVHLGNITYINGPIYLNQPNDNLKSISVAAIEAPTKKTYTKVRLIDRKNWLAQPSLSECEKLSEPAKYVIICHSATEDGKTHADNILLVRLIQQFHIESRNWGDIGYNFLIGSDGSTYMGRGWGVQGAHTIRYNRFSVGICFVGCFINMLPPEVALEQAKALIEQGVEVGAIDPNYSLLGHSQCISTESPGRMLFDEIRTWKNFDPTVSVQIPSPLIR